MTETLQAVSQRFEWLPSSVDSTVLLIGGLLLAVFVAWNASPWRCLAAWLLTFSIQVDAGAFHLSVSDLFLLPLAFGTLLSYLRGGRQVTFPKAPIIFATVFLTLGNFVTVLQLGQLPRWTWLNKDVGLLALLVPYFCIVAIWRSRHSTEEFVQKYVLCVSLVNAAGLLLYVLSTVGGFESSVNYGGMRFRGFMVDPNGYAGLVASTAVLEFSVLLLRKHRPVIRLAHAANACALVTGCLLTLSRGGILSLVAGGITLVFIMKGRATYTIMVAVAAIAIGVLWFSSKSDLSQFADERAEQRGGIETRIDYMNEGLRMYLSSPVRVITGIGIGTFIEHSVDYFGDVHQIHSTYVWLLVEGGPVILLTFVIILFGSMRHSYIVYRRNPSLRCAAAGCFCALVVMSVWCCTVEGMYHHHFWVLLAISELLWQQHKEQADAYRAEVHNASTELRSLSYVGGPLQRPLAP